MYPARHRPLSALLACAALLAGSALLLSAPARAADAAKPKPAAAAGKAAAKPNTARPWRKAAPPEPQPAALTVEDISPAQLGVAGRVLTGDADCEFKQQVSVLPVDGMPGYFNVTYQRKRYRMLPRETATGTVRLEDPDAGIVWLQIPRKSMLMNARIGQRMVDNCMHAEQRAAVNAVADAANSLGIVTPAPAAPAANPALAGAAAASAPVAQGAAPAQPAVAVAPAQPAVAAAAQPALVATPAQPPAAAAPAASQP